MSVKSILGLMDDDGARAIKNFVGDFNVAANGKAMHEFCVRFSGLEPGFSDAPFAEVFPEAHLRFWVAVVLGSNPRFAVENMGVFECFVCGVSVADGLCSEGFGFGDEFIGEGVRFGGMDRDVHSTEGGHVEGGAWYSVRKRFRVPGPTQDKVPVGGNIEFVQGLPIGEGLAWVVAR